VTAQWLLYGANGYTGELIAREAARRGIHPILAGRSAEKIEPLARELQCEARVFDVRKPDLRDVALVLHCAGPFIHTSAPMVDACLAAGVHYLDITGEIDVFEAVLARDAEAKQRNVALIPGVGFDVVPTDCLGAMLHARMPDAIELWLAFYSRRGGISRGTLRTMLEGLGHGGAIRRNGKIVHVPLLFDVREIPYESGPRLSMTIPWGDVATAFHTTGIPNIRVYNATPKATIRRLRRTQHFLPLMRLKPVKRAMQWLSTRNRTGPDETQRAQSRVELWGRVVNARGEEATLTLSTLEGYTFTVLSSLEAVRRVLQAPRAGAFTPARAFGMNFVHEVMADGRA
jgi:short subunit dehydrogenase-like uncharacterized protein